MSLKEAAKSPRASSGFLMVTIAVLLFLDNSEGQQAIPSSDLQRVQGGEPAPKDRFPYMCSVRKRGSGRHVCGGTLFDKNWIMTAAHCLDPDNPNAAGMSPFLYCGIYEREEQNETKRFTPSRCYLHHLWNGDVRDGSDIALCQLEKSANVAIPDLSNIGDDYTKLDVFSVLGWGRASSRGSLADVLQIGAGLRYVLPSSCNDEEDWAGSIINSMICAGFANPNTCRGDSGGPLFIRHDPDGRAKIEDPQLDLIVGITSFGAPNCMADAPGVYTRVSCYRPWIECIMQGREQDCSVHNPCGEDSSLCSGVPKSATSNETDALPRVIRALTTDDSETVKKLLCDGLNPNSFYDNSKSSLLHRAARYNAADSAKVLLQHGSQIEYKNSDGQTALSSAASYDSISVAKLLIESGADIATKSASGWTPLIYAARYNQPGVARILIENGANIEGVDDRRWTPLHFAAEEDSIDVTKELIEKGASIESKDRSDQTPLHIAAQNNAAQVAKELVANGARVASRDDKRQTPLHSAAIANLLAIVEILISNGANVYATERRGWTALHFAAQGNFIEVAKELISEGADIDAQTNDGFTALHLAASHGHPSVTRVLLDNGASKTITNDDGDTPFDVICTDRDFEEPCKDDDITTLQELLEV